MTKFENFVEWLKHQEVVSLRLVRLFFGGDDVYRVYYNALRRNGAIDLDNKVVPEKILAAWGKVKEENRERKHAQRQRLKFFRSPRPSKNY